MRCLFVLFLLAAVRLAPAHAGDALPQAPCGVLQSIETHAGTSTRFALAPARQPPAPGAPAAVLLLVGGGGVIDLDDRGCPQRLNGNVLLRMSPLLRAAGIATVLVDAPSDLRDSEGLGGFRNAAEHAEDLGRVIAAVRAHGQGPVWIIGHSRGTISAANAAARLSGAAAPDGVALLSPMLVGEPRARKAWVAQTVLGAGTEAIAVPLLAVGHAADNCPRSPAARLGQVIDGSRSVRAQAVSVSGGPGVEGRPPALAGCEVGEPHDFVAQEADLAAGLLRFMRGGRY